MEQKKLDSIMESARKIFARHGLRKTSLDEIANMARVARATIYNYFGNREHIYLEVLHREKDEVVQNVLSDVGKESFPEAKLAAFFKAKFRFMRKAYNILNLDREGVEKLLPIAEDIRNELFEREVEIIHTILIEGLEKEIFSLKNPMLTAKAIAYALKGFELTWLVQEKEEKIDQYLDELTTIVYHGILTKKI
jgi:AcrR family transcriptional regulator